MRSATRPPQTLDQLLDVDDASLRTLLGQLGADGAFLRSAMDSIAGRRDSEHCVPDAQRFLRRTTQSCRADSWLLLRNAHAFYAEIKEKITSINSPKRRGESVLAWLERCSSYPSAAETDHDLLRLAAEVAFRNIGAALAEHFTALLEERAPFIAACRELATKRLQSAKLRLTFDARRVLSSIDIQNSSKLNSSRVSSPLHFTLQHVPWDRSHGEPSFLEHFNRAKVRVVVAKNGSRIKNLRRLATARLGICLEEESGHYRWRIACGKFRLSPTTFLRMANRSPWPNLVVLPHGAHVLFARFHPALYELAARLPSEAVDARTRDEQLAALESIGAWLPEVFDSTSLKRGAPEMVALLGFTATHTPELEIKLACRLGPNCLTLSPDEGPDLLVAWHQDRVLIVVRNRATERNNLREASTQWGLRVGHDGRWSTKVAGDNRILEFLNRLPPEGVTLLWNSDRPSPFSPLDPSRLSVSVNRLEDFLRIAGEYSYSDIVIPLRDLLAEIRQRRRFFRAKDGTWFEISELVSKHLQTVAVGVTERNNVLELAPWAALAVVELGAEGASTSIPSGLPLPLPAQLRQAASVSVVLPDVLVTELRPYQVLGVEWLTRTSFWSRGAILGDDMGLGKSLQALTFAATRRHVGPTLVICGPSLLRNWQREAKKHLGDAFDAQIVHSQTGAVSVGCPGAGNLTITTYDRLRLDLASFCKVRWHTIIIDEAHELRNETTQRTAAVRKLVDSCARDTFVLGLTGTPIQNRVDDAYTLFGLVAPGYLGERKSFVGGLNPIAADETERLRYAIRPLFLRRRKADVAPELPAKIETTHEIELCDAERELYERYRRAAQDALDKALTLRVRGEVFTAIQLLRQLTCDVRLVDPYYRGFNSKTAFLLATIQALRDGGRCVLIFSQFTSYLDILGKELTRSRIDWTRLDGTMSPKARENAVHEFQADVKPVFLISLKAGGSGLNLTRASDVIIVDPWWNQAAEEQAADRAHRIGQDKTVVVHRLITKDTVEERVRAIGEQKRRIIDQVIEGDEVATPASFEELARILVSDNSSPQ